MVFADLIKINLNHIRLIQKLDDSNLFLFSFLSKEFLEYLMPLFDLVENNFSYVSYPERAYQIYIYIDFLHVWKNLILSASSNIQNVWTQKLHNFFDSSAQLLLIYPYAIRWSICQRSLKKINGESSLNDFLNNSLNWGEIKSFTVKTPLQYWNMYIKCQKYLGFALSSLEKLLPEETAVNTVKNVINDWIKSFIQIINNSSTDYFHNQSSNISSESKYDIVTRFGAQTFRNTYKNIFDSKQDNIAKIKNELITWFSKWKRKKQTRFRSLFEETPKKSSFYPHRNSMLETSSQVNISLYPSFHEKIPYFQSWELTSFLDYHCESCTKKCKFYSKLFYQSKNEVHKISLLISLAGSIITALKWLESKTPYYGLLEYFPTLNEIGLFSGFSNQKYTVGCIFEDDFINNKLDNTEFIICSIFHQFQNSLILSYCSIISSKLPISEKFHLTFYKQVFEDLEHCSKHSKLQMFPAYLLFIGISLQNITSTLLNTTKSTLLVNQINSLLASNLKLNVSRYIILSARTRLIIGSVQKKLPDFEVFFKSLITHILKIKVDHRNKDAEHIIPLEINLLLAQLYFVLINCSNISTFKQDPSYVLGVFWFQVAQKCQKEKSFKSLSKFIDKVNLPQWFIEHNIFLNDKVIHSDALELAATYFSYYIIRLQYKMLSVQEIFVNGSHISFIPSKYNVYFNTSFAIDQDQTNNSDGALMYSFNLYKYLFKNIPPSGINFYQFSNLETTKDIRENFCVEILKHILDGLVEVFENYTNISANIIDHFHLIETLIFSCNIIQCNAFKLYVQFLFESCFFLLIKRFYHLNFISNLSSDIQKGSEVGNHLIQCLELISFRIFHLIKDLDNIMQIQLNDLCYISVSYIYKEFHRFLLKLQGLYLVKVTTWYHIDAKNYHINDKLWEDTFKIIQWHFQYLLDKLAKSVISVHNYPVPLYPVIESKTVLKNRQRIYIHSDMLTWLTWVISNINLTVNSNVYDTLQAKHHSKITSNCLIYLKKPPKSIYICNNSWKSSVDLSSTRITIPFSSVIDFIQHVPVTLYDNAIEPKNPLCMLCLKKEKFEVLDPASYLFLFISKSDSYDISKQMIVLYLWNTFINSKYFIPCIAETVPMPDLSDLLILLSCIEQDQRLILYICSLYNIEKDYSKTSFLLFYNQFSNRLKMICQLINTSYQINLCKDCKQSIPNNNNKNCYKNKKKFSYRAVKSFIKQMNSQQNVNITDSDKYENFCVTYLHIYLNSIINILISVANNPDQYINPNNCTFVSDAVKIISTYFIKALLLFIHSENYNKDDVLQVCLYSIYTIISHFKGSLNYNLNSIMELFVSTMCKIEERAPPNIIRQKTDLYIYMYESFYSLYEKIMLYSSTLGLAQNLFSISTGLLLCFVEWAEYLSLESIISWLSLYIYKELSLEINETYILTPTRGVLLVLMFILEYIKLGKQEKNQSKYVSLKKQYVNWLKGIHDKSRLLYNKTNRECSYYTVANSIIFQPSLLHSESVIQFLYLQFLHSQALPCMNKLLKSIPVDYKNSSYIPISLNYLEIPNPDLDISKAIYIIYANLKSNNNELDISPTFQLYIECLQSIYLLIRISQWLFITNSADSITNTSPCSKPVMPITINWTYFENNPNITHLDKNSIINNSITYLDIYLYWCRSLLMEIMTKSLENKLHQMILNIMMNDISIISQISKASSMYNTSLYFQLNKFAEYRYATVSCFINKTLLFDYFKNEANGLTISHIKEEFSYGLYQKEFVENASNGTSKYAYGLQTLILLTQKNPIFNKQKNISEDFNHAYTKLSLKILLKYATMRLSLLVYNISGCLESCSNSIFIHSTYSDTAKVTKIMNSHIITCLLNFSNAHKNDSKQGKVMLNEPINLHSLRIYVVLAWLMYIIYTCEDQASFIKNLLKSEIACIEETKPVNENILVQSNQKRTVLELKNLVCLIQPKLDKTKKDFFHELIEEKQKSLAVLMRNDYAHRINYKKYFKSSVWPPFSDQIKKLPRFKKKRIDSDLQLNWIHKYAVLVTSIFYIIYSSPFQAPSLPFPNNTNYNQYNKIEKQQKQFIIYLLSAIHNIFNSTVLKKHGILPILKNNKLYENNDSIIPYHQLSLIQLIFYDELLRLYAWYKLDEEECFKQFIPKIRFGFCMRRRPSSLLNKNQSYYINKKQNIESRRIKFQFIRRNIFFSSLSRLNSSRQYISKKNVKNSSVLFNEQMLDSNTFKSHSLLEKNVSDMSTIDCLLSNPMYSFIHNWKHGSSMLYSTECSLKKYRKFYESSIKGSNLESNHHWLKNLLKNRITHLHHNIGWKHLRNVWLSAPPLLGHLQERFNTCKSLTREVRKFSRKHATLILYCTLVNPGLNMYHLHSCLTDDILETHTSTDISQIKRCFNAFAHEKMGGKNYVKSHLIEFPWLYISRLPLFYMLPLLNSSYKKFLMLKNVIIIKVLECQSPSSIQLFLPQLVQALRHDYGCIIEEMLAAVALRFPSIAILILFQLTNEVVSTEQAVKTKNILSFTCLRLISRILADSKALYTKLGFHQDILENQWNFYFKLITLSSELIAVTQTNRENYLKDCLQNLLNEINDKNLFLLWPLAGNLKVNSFNPKKAKLMQSAAKVPFMLSFTLTKILDIDYNRQLCIEYILNDEKSISKNELIAKHNFTYKSDAEEQRNLIFKSHDDVRQDQLALQIIRIFSILTKQIKSPLFLCLYSAIPIRSLTDYVFGGIIEVVPNSFSRHQLGKMFECSLSDYFRNKFDNTQTISTYDHITPYSIAQWQFLRSLAGCCVISYLLQVKDRHNGNLLITQDGKLIHIDFGFLFDISPGHDLKFEKAPFKLTLEMIEILGGSSKSGIYKTFEQLIVQGYLLMKQNAPIFLQLVSIMMDSGLPCLKKNSLINFRNRFQLHKNPQESAVFMKKQISLSYNALSTRLYDVVQSIQQGITH